MGNVFLYGVGAPACLFNATRDKMLPPLIPYAGNPMYDPCYNTRNAGYLNRADVQRALHVLPPAAAASGKDNAAVPWSVCSSAPILNYSGSSIGHTMSHLYPKILAAGIRILFLSGDNDGYVPTLGTRSWMGSLKQLVVLETAATSKTKADQVPWINEMTGQVGGYITKYAVKRAGNRPRSKATLELAVFLSAGHAVPSFQPSGVIQVVKSWMREVMDAINALASSVNKVSLSPKMLGDQCSDQGLDCPHGCCGYGWYWGCCNEP